MIKISSHTFGFFFQANSYIGVNEKGEAFAVDIGGDSERFLKFLEENGLTLKMILLTHGHFDHIRGVADVSEKTGAKVYIHSDDAVMLTDPEACLSRFVGGMEFKPVNDFVTVSDGDVLDFCGTEIKVIHTPGHT
ncbi:MAG: MBL fold metallo-hydrolase, partial [Oscillospiraceae bacterium]|nr:MBL fold metallo-hydrolase [Oscillospiraceae bacterium]